MRASKLLLLFSSLAAASLAASPALATDCTTLPNPIYVVGSTAIGPVVAKISAYLATQPTPITVVYGGTGSCNGVATAVATATNPSTAGISSPAGAPAGYFAYADATGTAQTCDITPVDGGTPVLANVALSDVFAESCQMLPNGLGTIGLVDKQGPVQAMTFVVPTSSSEYAISAQAAYFVFGFGSASNVAPWTSATHLFQRGKSSGTQTMLGAAITVPAGQWYGVIESSTSAMIGALTTANVMNDGMAIGILGAADIDPFRRAGMSSIRELAFKAFGQNCGYLPDSAAGAFDKRNVRDGHYDVWGPLHAIVAMTTTSAVDTFVSYLIGTAPTGGLDVIASEAQAGLVPQCAMRVSRTTEVGPMTPSSPATPCGCYYEYTGSPNHTTSCTACQNATSCPTGYSCPLYNGMGWCEAP